MWPERDLPDLPLGARITSVRMYRKPPVGRGHAPAESEWLIRLVAIIVMVGYLVAVSAAVTRASGQPHVRSVTEPGTFQPSSGTEPDGFQSVLGLSVARMEPSVKGGSASGSVTVPLYHQNQRKSTEASSRPSIPLFGFVERKTLEERQGYFHGRSAQFWNAKYVRMRHLAYVRRGQTRKLRRVLLASPSVTEAINLAGATYGHTDTLWRKARCESGLNPSARNGSEASGLLQFLPSTWATTPYARFSIWSPYANALAAGWMHAHGRGSEWVCR